LTLSRRLARGHFELAILLPNSFRIALIARMARIPRRVGYDRDGRSGLLTDRLLPRRRPGGFVPVPTRDYYLGIASYLGSPDAEPRMELFTRPADDARAEELLRPMQKKEGQPLVLMAPGANYGTAKMWYPQRYGALADRCVAELGAAVAIFGSPQEAPILQKVREAARQPLTDLTQMGADLRVLKSIIKRSDVLVTNDTGPRHMAAAFGIPVVSIFGPTDPAWSDIGYALERQVMVSVFCGPCQKKRCPLDHRCMGRIGPEMVFEKVAELLKARAEVP
jgi:heptosyltransferase II